VYGGYHLPKDIILLSALSESNFGTTDRHDIKELLEIDYNLDMFINNVS